MSYRMPIKRGRLFNIRRELRTCHLCNYIMSLGMNISIYLNVHTFDNDGDDDDNDDDCDNDDDYDDNCSTYF